MNSKFELKKVDSNSSSSESDTSESTSSKSSSSSSSYTSSFSSDGSSSKNSKHSKNSKKSSGRSNLKSKKNDLNSSFKSTSHESLESNANLSRANSLKNLQEEYEPISSNLPYNVYQLLYSIKESMINIYNFKKQFNDNLKKIKSNKHEENIDLKKQNEILLDSIVNESVGCVSLSQVIYGSSHWKLALAHTNLAQIYLELANLPKQAKNHCEKAWSILIEDLKDQARYELNTSQQDESYKYLDPDSNKHQMMINYIYGRACTLLKENEEGELSLTKAEEYYQEWRTDLIERNQKIKYKLELRLWKQKIYLALAKQYAINNYYSNAIEYYDRSIDLIKNSNRSLETNYLFSDECLIEIYTDKSKIELNKDHFHIAIDLAKESLNIALNNNLEILIQECKLNLALIYSQLNDMNSSLKAEDLFKEIFDSYLKIFKKPNELTIKFKDELVKFYLKQEKYDDACNLLNGLIKDKIDYYGDFNLKLNTSYKFLCSVNLKKNDMSNAVKYLNKSLELEELNYGKQDKRTNETRDTLNNLKMNPNIQSKLNDKPKFNVVNKIDYLKEDKKLYTTPKTDDLNLNQILLNKKINPIK